MRSPFTQSTAVTRQPDAIGAWLACEHFVKDHLRAPATADFGPFDESAVGARGANTFIVRGHVDAENAFSAMVRMNFECVVHGDENGRWTLDRLVW